MSLLNLPGRALSRVSEFLPKEEQRNLFPVCKKWNQELVDHRTRFLDPTRRPEAIQKEIDAAYQRIIGRTLGWRENGRDMYGICGIDDSLLIKKVIQEAPPSRCVFVFVDIGGGDKAIWSEEQAKFINSQKDLREDIRVIFISLKGEKHTGPSRIQDGRCLRINLGSFKIEEIQARLKKLGYPRIDGAFTRWCLRHLVDPVGVVVQVINMLRPETGIFLGDGFLTVDAEKDPMKCLGNYAFQMTQLFLALKIPFLKQKWTLEYALDQFFIRKCNDNPCELPWSYAGLYPFKERDSAAGCATVFKSNQPAETGLDHHEYDILYGSRSLYKYLYESELTQYPWEPIKKSESVRENSPLHEAVISGDLEAVKRRARKDNINDPNIHGETAVVLAIRGGHDDILQFLVKEGANVRLLDRRKVTPLVKAIESPRSEIYVPLLLESGADMNVGRIKALDRAVNLIKKPIISLLQAKGARCLYSKGLLEDPIKLRFQPIELYYLNNHPLENYVANIVNWLNLGDCVILRYQGDNLVLYRGLNDPSLKDVRLVSVNVHDDVALSPVLELLEKEGYSPRATPFAKAIVSEKDIPHAFAIDFSPKDLTPGGIRWLH